MKTTPLHEELRNLAMQIAPELKQRPLYLCDASDLGEFAQRRGGCDLLGWASKETPAAIQAHLGNRWEGAGPTISLDGSAIVEQCKPGSFARCAENVFLHEVGHILPARQVSAPAIVSPALANLSSVVLQRGLESSATDPSSDPHHGPEFIRRSIHLLVRAAAVGRNILWDELLGPWSRTEHYVPLLLAEALTMRDATFEQIEALPLLPGVRDQWRADCDFYKLRQEQRQ